MKLEFILIAWFSAEVKWDYDRYAESKIKREAESGKYFPKTELGSIIKPTILVDRHGKIILWYLPGLVLPERVVCLTPFIQSVLHANFVFRKR